MDRLACVNVAALPLQLLLNAHSDWASLPVAPVAVVEHDRPQGLVLFLNAPARRAGVRSGQRYATALALCRDLRAGTVSPSEIDRGIRSIADRLRRYTPHVEPSSNLPGVFWLDASGLHGLYPSLQVWAEAIQADLQRAGLRAAIAVGFSRFGVYALALSHRGPIVCADAADERAQVQQVSLARLHLDPGVRDRLLALGVETAGGFLRLPGSGIAARFGADAEALHRLAAGDRWAPLVPVPAEQRHERSVDFDAPESHVERLVFVIKRLLDGLVPALERQGLAVAALVLSMRLDDRTTQVERVRPAAPTLEVAQLLTLVRLRLDSLRLAAGVVTLTLTAETCPATADQRRLFEAHTRREADAANHALARIRAECGEPSVVRARLCDAHLPSARFVWEPLERVATRAAPRVVAARPLVRRIYAQAVAVNEYVASGFSRTSERQSASPLEVRLPPSQDASASLTGAFGVGGKPDPTYVSGPYVLSGGWWGQRGGVHREYYFVHTGRGELWWVYYDHRRKRLFIQGKVE